MPFIRFVATVFVVMFYATMVLTTFIVTVSVGGLLSGIAFLILILVLFRPKG